GLRHRRPRLSPLESVMHPRFVSRQKRTRRPRAAEWIHPVSAVQCFGLGCLMSLTQALATVGQVQTHRCPRSFGVLTRDGFEDLLVLALQTRHVVGLIV